MGAKTKALPKQDNWRYWRGLGGWNFYFLVKLGLLWFGYLNFHPFLNLVFLAYLLFPLRAERLHRLRNLIALPLGFALFYHDTWLPGVDSIVSQGSQVAGFSGEYLLELMNRFVNWQMIGAGLVLLVAYLYLSQWIRITVFTVAAITWLNVITLGGPAIALLPAAQTASRTAGTVGASAGAGSAPAVNLPPTNANLAAYLTQFYDREKGRITAFPSTLPADAQPFDLLVINICSLSWSDLQASHLDTHPLWQRFDLMFKNFNSATAYSGPASIRLLRASCGQQSHHDLYQPTKRECFLFENLAALGFKTQLMLDHNGVFGNYLQDIQQEGDMQIPMMSQAGVSNQLTSFDGSPIYNDREMLGRWFSGLKPQATERSATFFNLVTLHDGDRFVGTNKSADFAPRANMLFDELNAFFDDLEKSGRKVMVVVVPEHGAALEGDKMQMSGLRDIPSPSITHIPVGIKLFGAASPHQGAPIDVTAPSSYLAISTLVSRMVDGKSFSVPTLDWAALIQDLPQTEAISENENATVMRYQDGVFIRLNGGDWVPYPQ